MSEETRKTEEIISYSKHSSGFALWSVRCLLFANCEVKSRCVVHTWAHDACAFIVPLSLVRKWSLQDWLKIFFLDTCCE